jgi:hypothetical protein
MRNTIASCPECRARLQIENPYEPVRCSMCGKIFTARNERSEAEELFLSGSSFLALGDYESAADKLLQAAKLSPSEPKNWLYLLLAITERFSVLFPLVDETAAFSIGKRRIIYKSVYKNFVSTAKKDDYIFAKSEFDIDLDPNGTELWESIINEILYFDTLPMNLRTAARLAQIATEKLEANHPETAKSYYGALCKRLNPVREGVLEVHSLLYYPESPDGVLHIETQADSIEFCSDDLPGAENYSAFLLTDGIENIGNAYPFAELTVANGVTRIPSRLMNFCGNLRKVTLSSTVKSIGASAFSDCVNLKSVSPLDSLESIGDKAFYGTSVRVLDLPRGLKKLGKEVLGAKEGAVTEIEKYLIELDAQTLAESPDFNKVGEHRCGYLSRQNDKCAVIYPEKTVGGAKKPLTHDEKMIFKALAAISMQNNGEGSADKISGTIGAVLGKLRKRK